MKEIKQIVLTNSDLIVCFEKEVIRLKLKKIDMHVHCCEEKGPERLRSDTWPLPGELRAIYDIIGVEKGVLMVRLAPERSHDPITNKEAYRLVQNFPETLGWWFCYMDPRMGTNSPNDNLSYYLDYYKERGAKGVGEIQANIYLDDPRYMNLFYHCEKSGMPVTIHFGVLGVGCGAADDIGLVRLERVLKTFPKLKILGHAMPFWAEISTDVTEENRNGSPKGKVVQEGRLVTLMRKYPNLLCDLSAGSGYNAITRDPEFSYKFLNEFNERIYYATDIRETKDINNPMLKLSEFLDDAVEHRYISQTAYSNICRNNALALLEQ